MKIKPILDRILIREIKEERKSDIIIPDTIDKPKQGMGKVIAVGGGKITDNGKEPMDISVGDIIIFARRIPLIIDDEEGGEFLMIYYEDVLTKIEK